MATILACMSYAATLTLGTLSLRGRKVPRVWHARLFMLTAGITVIAALLSLPGHWPRGLLLALALVPLSLLPFVTVPVRAHPRRHALLGISASPFYLAALVAWGFSLR